MNRRYDAVIFDAGETLVHPSPSFGHGLTEILGSRGFAVPTDEADHRGREVLATAIARALDEKVHWTTSADASRRFWSAVYERLLAKLEVPDPSGEVASLLYDEFSKPDRYGLFPDALPALRELTVHGYRLGLVSNWEGWLEDLLGALGVAPLLATVVVSGSFGAEKPDPSIFRAALEEMDVKPDRAVYVGDSLHHDIEPALELGMGAVLIDRSGRARAGYSGPLIRSLEQLAAVLA